eukprot:Sspe_Gene.2099::Locus_696_Transcript_1_2_Confidence_0.500_Length_771::g.2099::m.2099
MSRGAVGRYEGVEVSFYLPRGFTGMSNTHGTTLRQSHCTAKVHHQLNHDFEVGYNIGTVLWRPPTDDCGEYLPLTASDRTGSNASSSPPTRRKKEAHVVHDLIPEADTPPSLPIEASPEKPQHRPKKRKHGEQRRLDEMVQLTPAPTHKTSSGTAPSAPRKRPPSAKREGSKAKRTLLDFMK